MIERDRVELRQLVDPPTADEIEPGDLTDRLIVRRFGPQQEFFDFGPDFDPDPF